MSDRRKIRNLMAAILTVSGEPMAPSPFGAPVVNKDEQCKGCKHLEHPDDGHCYMFKDFQPGCKLNKSKDEQ